VTSAIRATRAAEFARAITGLGFMFSVTETRCPRLPRLLHASDFVKRNLSRTQLSVGFSSTWSMTSTVPIALRDSSFKPSCFSSASKIDIELSGSDA